MTKEKNESNIENVVSSGYKFEGTMITTILNQTLKKKKFSES